MKIEEVKKRYPNEWVLVEVLKEDEFGNPVDVKVLAHSKSRDEIREALRKAKDKYTYHFYTGEIPEAVAFKVLT